MTYVKKLICWKCRKYIAWSRKCEKGEKPDKNKCESFEGGNPQ